MRDRLSTMAIPAAAVGCGRTSDLSPLEDAVSSHCHNFEVDLRSASTSFDKGAAVDNLVPAPLHAFSTVLFCKSVRGSDKKDDAELSSLGQRSSVVIDSILSHPSSDRALVSSEPQELVEIAAKINAFPLKH